MESKNISNDEESKQIETKGMFENLNSNFVLKKIFDFMKKNKSLILVKKNKILKKRLNISINTYRECSQIIIDLKLADNKYGKFINIPKKDKEYYHIYFDNSKEEIKRDYLEENEKVKTIKISIDYQVNSLKGLFYNCKPITSIFFTNFFRDNITDMGNMFSQCTSLKELNLSNFNTTNVTNMTGMFYGCYSLKELNLSNFDTSNVTSMNNMFFGCSSIETLNLSNFNTEKLTEMDKMFYECSSLIELDISSFKTDNVTYMTNAFYDCSSLKELYISKSFNTNKVTNKMSMFSGCSKELKKKISKINNDLVW